MSPRPLVAVALAALLAASLAGCPGSLDDPGRFGFGGGGAGGGGGSNGGCVDVPTLFSTSCALGGCHAATTPAAGLDLASPNVFERLSGKAAAGGSGMLIDPSAPPSSILYLKLIAPPPYGSRMPLTGSALDAATVSCVLTWIETNAAASDGGASDAGASDGSASDGDASP